MFFTGMFRSGQTLILLRLSQDWRLIPYKSTLIPRVPLLLIKQRIILACCTSLREPLRVT